VTEWALFACSGACWDRVKSRPRPNKPSHRNLRSTSGLSLSPSSRWFTAGWPAGAWGEHVGSDHMAPRRAHASRAGPAGLAAVPVRAICVGQPRSPCPWVPWLVWRSPAAVGRGGAEAGMRIPATSRKKTLLNFERRVPTVFFFQRGNGYSPC
jgi:hypothetical protein